MASQEELQTQLDTLKRMLYRGVKSVREKDTYIEFNSFPDMEKAIRKLEVEIGIKKPMGTKRVRVSRGY